MSVVNGWFPHISTAGKIVSGAGQIYVGTADEWAGDTAANIDAGNAPRWLDQDTILYNYEGGSSPVTRIRNLVTGVVTDVAFGCNSFAADNGWWQGLQQSGAITLKLFQGLVETQTWTGRGSPSISPTGGWANVDQYSADTHNVYVNGTKVYTGAVMRTSMSSAKTCLLLATGTYTRQVLVLPSQDNTIESWEDPCIINGPTSEPDWILSVTQTGLILRPAGSTVGYRWSGEYLNPWARFVSGKFIIAASSSAGEPKIIQLSPSDPRTNLITGEAGGAVPPGGTTPDVETVWKGFGGGGSVPGITTLFSQNTFDIATAPVTVVTLDVQVYVARTPGQGCGRLVHPILGAFDYEVKPDEWVNFDKDAIIPPLWASSRTLTSAANTLWSGILKDVVVEERWKALGGLSMPATQLRMLLTLWTTPLDPDVGYVQWHPDYASDKVFRVMLLGLTVGGNQGVTFDDVINYKDEDDNPIGWVSGAVTLQMKIVEPV